MKQFKLPVYLLVASMLLAHSAMAQTKIKDGTVTGSSALPDTNAILDLESADKGLLLPRVALTATDQAAPLTGHAAGMTVYNTATAGSGATAVMPGYYYNDGTQWVRVGEATAYKEPWRIQNTTTPADSNTQNIYQKGKVAIGFSDTDAVSSKQLDVKGTLRAQWSDSTSTVGIDNSYDPYVGTPYEGALTSPALYAFDSSSFLNATAGNQVVASGIPGLGGASISSFSKFPDGNAITANQGVQAYEGGGIATMEVNDDTTNTHLLIQENSASLNKMIQISAQAKNNDGLGSLIYVTRDTTGIQFRFFDTTGATMGGYTFPRTTGLNNQVMTVDGFMPGSGMAHLTWSDATIHNITSGATLSDTDYTLQASGNVTLPAANNANKGKVYNIVYNSSGAVTVTGSIKLGATSLSSVTLDGAATTGITIQSNGGAWVVIGKF